MATTIPSEIESATRNKVEKHGILLATVEPTRESKGAWSELHLFEGEIYNSIYGDTQDCWFVMIEKLDSPEELKKYIGEEEAKSVIEKHTL